MFFRKILFSGLLALTLTLSAGLSPVIAQESFKDAATQGFKPSYEKAKNPARTPSDVMGYESGEFQETEDVVLLGQKHTLTFWQIPESSMTWDDAKKYLPKEVALASQNKAAVTDQELLIYISKLATQAALNYDAYAQEDFQLKKAQHMAEHPGLPEETVSVLIFEQYHGNNGWKNSARAQEAHNTYLALTYVADALRLKLGMIEKRPSN